MITVSEKALLHVINLMMESGITPDSHHLRVGVKGGGCSGLSYVMDFDTTIESTDETVEIDGGLKVVIDRKSVLYLYGTELDYSDGLNGKGFQWVNPNASRTCGCGESFAL
jgi:iron-sulfur cluster assembly protein